MVTVEVPAHVEYVRPVRLAVGGLAAVAGFDVEAIEDLRIGVDELCAAVVELSDGSSMSVRILLSPGRIRIEGRAPEGDDPVDETRFTLSRQILSVVADDHELLSEDGTVCCWFERGGPHRAPPLG